MLRNKGEREMKYETAEEMAKVTKRAEFNAVYLSILERAKMGQYDYTVGELSCIFGSDHFKGLHYEFLCYMA